MPAAEATASELSVLVKEYFRGGIVGIVRAVAIGELLAAVVLRLDEINDGCVCLLRIKSRFTPILDVGLSPNLLGTFDAGSIVGVFLEAVSLDNIDGELSPRTREGRTLGPCELVFCGDGTAVSTGPFPTNDNGRLALAISP